MFIKRAASHLLKNWGNAKPLGRNALRGSGGLSSFAITGAGIGATWGLADNIFGEDKVSVLEGAMRGAAIGAGVYGARGALRMKLAAARRRPVGIG